MKKHVFGILALAAIFAFVIISFLSAPANASAQELVKDSTSHSFDGVASNSACSLASGSESTCPMANGDLDGCPALHGGNCPLVDFGSCSIVDGGFGEDCPMRNNHKADSCQS